MEICVYCNKEIDLDEELVPHYHAKAPAGQPKRYRHKDCPKVEES